ncbi:phosphoribosyl-AMP cyclohydrolase [Fructobacillus ficulneus]|uniref:Phosphoribosyl-AMP cyclohydrolase n=1 Tax=Fructobacillus ficulneus TaxID=157463 RepID=A0A0K8MHI0_9LACO|nr:phosphoribosyl-AMP cyclohydrolase [Fructobacillus ficulneus]GAO99638.1 phosphoribosyl-AMP cyclohydrolase [Fructobacillus ficulneus]
MTKLEPDFTKADQDGLVPAVVVDSKTKAVLMLAYMNAESYRLTQETGETWFWSRSRQELWNKGATSGNRQQVVSLTLDCDLDTVLLEVNPVGPACHTGEYSCFFNLVQEPTAIDSREPRK